MENCCCTTIKEAESNGTSRAHSSQQSHTKDIQCLEAEAIEEEGKDHLTFLTPCGAALRASPPKSHGIMVTPYHLLLGNAPMSTLLSIPQGYPLLNGNLPYGLLLPLPQQPLDPCPGPNGSITHLTRWVPLPHLRLLPKQPLRSHPIPSRRRNCLSARPCQGVTRRPLTGTPCLC